MHGGLKNREGWKRMQFHEQGTVGHARYSVVPRTLSFVLCEGALLLLRGAPTKRLWANRLNGLGGHIEPGEDPRQGALREIREEAGLAPASLELRALLHVSGQEGHPGVMLFVFVGEAESRAASGSAEGRLEWHPLDALPWQEMVADLPHLLPRLLAGDGAEVLYGCYQADATGEMHFTFGDETGPRTGEV
jgi:8-oxo-dGTP diphosphatase